MSLPTWKRGQVDFPGFLVVSLFAIGTQNGGGSTSKPGIITCPLFQVG
jgi:hypothetical protein